MVVAGTVLLGIALLYIAIGLAVAFRFATVTAARFTERAEVGSFPFRLFLIPGAIALWPLVVQIDSRGVAPLPLHFGNSVDGINSESTPPGASDRPDSVGENV